MTTRLNMPKRPSTPIISETPVAKANAATAEIRKPCKIIQQIFATYLLTISRRIEQYSSIPIQVLSAPIARRHNKVKTRD